MVKRLTCLGCLARREKGGCDFGILTYFSITPTGGHVYYPAEPCYKPQDKHDYEQILNAYAKVDRDEDKKN